MLLLSLASFGQEGERLVLKGKIIDSETQEPVPMVTVLIVNKKKGTSGNSKGQFVLPVEIGDHVKISSIGYQPVEFLVTEEYKAYIGEEMLLFMAPATYELDSVVVMHFGEDFYLRRKKSEPIEIIGLPKPTENPRDWSKPQIVADGNGVGIYGLLNIFDKKLQEQKKLRKLQAQHNERNDREARIEARYNKEIVKEVTGIDDRVIDEFMEFCNFTDGEILRSNEYEITARLIKRYYAFLRR